MNGNPIPNKWLTEHNKLTRAFVQRCIDEDKRQAEMPKDSLPPVVRGELDRELWK